MTPYARRRAAAARRDAAAPHQAIGIGDDRPAASRDAGFGCAGGSQETPGWRELARTAVRLVGTPCFVLSESHLSLAVRELDSMHRGLRHRHWLSLKTQPVKPLLEAWIGWGLDVEVVSEFELAAVLGVGLSPERILVNGVGKHHWLGKYRVARLNVHFDSLAEVRGLRTLALECGWRVGLRCQAPIQASEHHPELPDQFGMTADEAITAVGLLQEAGLCVRGMHFHVHTNMDSVDHVAHTLAHVRAVCDSSRLEPEYIDIGGGLPVPGERPVDGRAPASATFDLQRFAAVLVSMPRLFPGAREVWLENGRFVSARAGVLALKVLDRKDRPDSCHLICDGGRTNHARMAALETHEVLVEPARRGPARMTTICGPTCATVDRLGRLMLPQSVEAGDLLVWTNAGAYHIPLETRFSFGLAPVVWFDGQQHPHIARHRESPEQWWAQWA